MPAISVKNLTKTFKSFKAVDGLTFDAAENHVIGFLGPNGAGKTTTLRMLVGLSRPTSGEIVISGQPVQFGQSAAHYGVGYLPELPSMYTWLTGHEYLSFVADTFDMSETAKKKTIRELLKLVGLTDAKDRRIGTYSGGMKQRLGIAQALVNDPKVIILDEPVSALDPLGRKDVLEVIEKLKSSRTILLSTHILSDVDKICDDIVLINHGKLVAAQPLPELKAAHATPLLEIELNTDATALARKVSKEPWAQKVQQNGNVLKVWLGDNAVIETNVPLQFLAKQEVGILSYGLRLPETEDLFVELLGEQS